jgi:hypothetical protein
MRIRLVVGEEVAEKKTQVTDSAQGRKDRVQKSNKAGLGKHRK